MLAQDAILNFIVALLAGAVIGLLILMRERVTEFLRESRRSAPASYSDRIRRLLNSLSRTSMDIDATLVEIAEVMREREAAVHKLDAEIKRLEVSQKDYESRIAALKDIPLPAVDHLLKQLEPGERRSARRDYALFFAGVIVSAAVSLILALLRVGA
jgi:hypothetical protein